MATTNDESWQAWVNRMYRDEDRYLNELRFREMPVEASQNELTQEERRKAEQFLKEEL
jgi:hypothetical protein